MVAEGSRGILFPTLVLNVKSMGGSMLEQGMAIVKNIYLLNDIVSSDETMQILKFRRHTLVEGYLLARYSVFYLISLVIKNFW